MTADHAALDNNASTLLSHTPSGATLALDQIQRVCRSMFDMALEPSGPPSAFDPASLLYGACISLIGESGSSELALFGDNASCSSLARVFFQMEVDQSPAPDEIVDAMGELLNMVTGAVKTGLDHRNHQKLTIGIPNFLISHADCAKYQTRVIPLVTQRITSSQLDGALHLVWSERTPLVLLEEAGACVADPSDKLALGNGLAALGELLELVTETTSDENLATIRECQRLLIDVINERHQQSTTAVRQLIDGLKETVGEDVPLSQQVVTPVAAAPPAVQKVERDPDTLEMLREFVSESQERLEKSDELLLLFEAGRGNKDVVAELFRHFHTIKGVSSFHGLPEVEHLAHSTESLLASARDGSRELQGTALDLVFESTALLSRAMEQVHDAVEKSLAFPTSQAARVHASKIEAFLRGEAVETRGSCLQAAAKPVESVVPPPATRESVKVELDELNRLDALLPSFRKAIAVLDSRSEVDKKQLHAQLSSLLSQAEGLTARMRMEPLRGLFQKMARMARDLAKKTEKLVQLVLEGEDLRVGRNVVEKLNGPLVHMIRNAIDHGLESAEARREAKKPLIGTIRLSARVIGDQLQIEVADDGKGLDAAAILAKARARGLVAPGQRPKDKELFALIFESGFSTAAQVTAISGRGVGMDVVRRDIESLRGRIDIESRAGSGSTFCIFIPDWS